MSYKIEDGVSVIGGDSRMIEVAKIFSKRCKVSVFGFDNIEWNSEKIEVKDNIADIVNTNNIIITSIPLSKDNININVPYGKNVIKLEELFNENDLSNKLIITGKLPESTKNKLEQKCNVINILDRDDFAILNSIATAEGTIEAIVNNTNKTIHKSNILILGFGRVGKVVANRLKGLGANIYCTARKSSDFAWMEALGYNKIEYSQLKENIYIFDVIINTVPSNILNEDEIKVIDKDCFILDISSMPGGISSDICNKYNIKNMLYLGIPGKVAPVTSGEMIVKTVDNIINEINKIKKET